MTRFAEQYDTKSRTNVSCKNKTKNASMSSNKIFCNLLVNMLCSCTKKRDMRQNE